MLTPEPETGSGESRPRVALIAGPTASGKSALAIRLARMADGGQTALEGDPVLALAERSRRRRVGAIDRPERVLGEEVEDVGEQELLMLLLVRQAKREMVQCPRIARLQQGQHPLVDMTAIGVDRVQRGPGQQAAPGPVVASAASRVPSNRSKISSFDTRSGASVVSVASLVVVTVDAGPGLIAAVFVSFGGEVFSTSASILANSSVSAWTFSAFFADASKSSFSVWVVNEVSIGDAGVGDVTASSSVLSAPFLPTYAAQLCDIIRKGVNSKENFDRPLTGMKIVVDAGNGSGGFFADMVLKELGADTEGSQFLDPDGNFPNHSPNPEDKEAMASAVQCVVNSKADLGVVFDTDVDRSAVIDSNGKEINRNKLIALLAEIVLKETPGATIVTDSVTSDGLHKFITSKGGKHLRFMRGYKNVINKGKREMLILIVALQVAVTTTVVVTQ